MPPSGGQPWCRPRRHRQQRRIAQVSFQFVQAFDHAAGAAAALDKTPVNLLQPGFLRFLARIGIKRKSAGAEKDAERFPQEDRQIVFELPIASARLTRLPLQRFMSIGAADDVHDRMALLETFADRGAKSGAVGLAVLGDHRSATETEQKMMDCAAGGLEVSAGDAQKDLGSPGHGEPICEGASGSARSEGKR